jgi:hypothetical protein
VVRARLPPQQGGTADAEDEDFALEVKIPTDMDRDQVMNVCLQHAVHIEDVFGFSILIRVKYA